jgi:hypothetical protein
MQNLKGRAGNWAVDRSLARAGRVMWVLLALECATVVGCASEVASTDPNVVTASGGEERPRRRRRRRRAVDATASVAATSEPGASGVTASATGVGVSGELAGSSGDRASAPVSEMGSPVVVSGGAAASAGRVEWLRDGEGGQAQCGNVVPIGHHRCPQCPREPENAGIVRAFVAVERSVIRCSPPTRPDGKLAVRVEFAHNGAPVAVRFPGVRLDDSTALCLARAVCAARVPNFQNPVAIVPYEIHVLVPES